MLSSGSSAASQLRTPARALTLVYPMPQHYPAPSVLLQWSATASETPPSPLSAAAAPSAGESLPSPPPPPVPHAAQIARELSAAPDPGYVTVTDGGMLQRACFGALAFPTPTARLLSTPHIRSMVRTAFRARLPADVTPSQAVDAGFFFLQRLNEQLVLNRVHAAATTRAGGDAVNVKVEVTTRQLGADAPPEYRVTIRNEGKEVRLRMIVRA